MGSDNMERTGMVVKAVEGVLHDVGEIGQTGVVWFSMGVAMWQMILMARHLIFSGNQKNRQKESSKLLTLIRLCRYFTKERDQKKNKLRLELCQAQV